MNRHILSRLVGTIMLLIAIAAYVSTPNALLCIALYVIPASAFIFVIQWRTKAGCILSGLAFGVICVMIALAVLGRPVGKIYSNVVNPFVTSSGTP